MLIYGLLTVSTVILSYFVGKKGKVADYAALFGIFLLLSFVSVLRVNIGNDYSRYTQIFHELKCDGYVITEPLFNKVGAFVMKFPLFGEASYQVLFALFAVVTIALFLKNLYDYSENFCISFFLFMTLGLYFQTYSTVRYYFALAIVLYAIRFLLKKQYVVFVLLLLLASGFHKSALIAIPFYFLANLPYNKWKAKKWVIAAFVVICLQFLIFQDFYLEIMVRLYPSYEEEKELLQGGTSYANILRAAITLFLCLFVDRGSVLQEQKYRFFFTLNVFALALYTCGYYVPVISRIGYFLNIGQLILIPAVIQRIRKETTRKYAKMATLFAGAVFYFLFLRIARGSLAIVPYQTWVFTDMERIMMPIYTILGIQ